MSESSLPALNFTCQDDCYQTAEIFCGYRYQHDCRVESCSTTSPCYTGVSEPVDTVLLVPRLKITSIDLTQISSLIDKSVYIYGNEEFDVLERFICNYGPLCVLKDEDSGSNFDDMVVNATLTEQFYLENVVLSKNYVIYTMNLFLDIF